MGGLILLFQTDKAPSWDPWRSLCTASGYERRLTSEANRPHKGQCAHFRNQQIEHGEIWHCTVIYHIPTSFFYSKDRLKHVHMADYNSRPKSGLSQLIPASQPCHSQEKAGFTAKNTDFRWAQRSSDNKQDLAKGLNKEISRSFNGSDENSHTTEPAIIPDFGQPQLVDAVSLSSQRKNSILPWNIDAMSLDASLNTYNTIFEMRPGGFHGSFGSTGESISAAEATSPRSHMNVFQDGRPNHSPITHSGPLDRFFAQNDDLTDLSDDSMRLEEEWKRLRFLRANVVRLRAELRNKRKDLQEKQLGKDIADGRFMKFLRETPLGMISTLNSPHTPLFTDHVLETYYAEMQSARDECGPLQYEYNVLEDRLDDEEFELAKIEGRLYKTKAHDFLFQETGFPVPELPPPPPESLRGLSSEPEYHPLYADYLSRLGDLDLAREKLQSMVQEREDIFSLHGSRAHLGIEFNGEDQEFLSQFPDLEVSVKREIAEIEEDVERCRLNCIANGIAITEGGAGNSCEDEGSPQSIPPADDDIILQEAPVRGADTQISMYPKLLPKSVEGKTKLSVLITDFAEGNKSDRINRWILHQLQISPLEVELLVRVSLQVLHLLDFYEWQKWVLKYWYQDAANMPPETFNQNYTASSTKHTSTMTRGRPNSKSEKILSGTTALEIPPYPRSQSCPEEINLDVVPRARHNMDIL